MTAIKRPRKAKYERFELAASPWVQDLTQRDLARLLGWKKQQLEALVRDKERYTRRQQKVVGAKLRNLAVPVGKLRTIHERIKVHLNRIRQPEYLFSPRKGRGQRDNAEHHAGQIQFLSLDIRQFYPSTTDEHIFRWAYHTAGMRSDVAGLFTKLVAIDGKMPFGSPVSPVLTTLVHREMFDEIFEICVAHGLKMSVWVDDLTISGLAVPGELIDTIRAVIRKRGFQTHKILFRLSARPVIITGVPVIKGRVMAPRSLHRRIQDGYAELRSELPDSERGQVIDRLLSSLGTHRYHVGSTTEEGRKTSNRMHALRQRRSKLSRIVITPRDPEAAAEAPPREGCQSAPWD